MVGCRSQRWVVGACLLLGVGGPVPSSAARGAPVSASAPAGLPDDTATPLATGLSGQLAVALAGHPRVMADFARWHAAAHRVSGARTLPSPTVDFAVFVQSIETRTGPQVARLGVRQALPWPAALGAAHAGAGDGAAAAGAQFEATVLDVALAVETAHWDLWTVRAARAIHRDHRELVAGLSSTVRGRVGVGAAQLADLQQVDLTHARLSDDIARMDEAEQAAVARLRAAVGTWTDAALPTPEAPGGPFLPAEEALLLDAAASAHPRLKAARHQVAAADAGVRSARVRRLPSLSVGADWILVAPTADGAMVSPEDDGRDAVAVGVGVQVPLWQRSAADQVTAAESSARAARATADAVLLDARAALHQALADVESSGRRAAVIEGTLLPQAEAAYASLLGTYTASSSTVAQALLAQQSLLELRLDLVRAQAAHARAWARLRAVCGRDVETRRLVRGESP